jgi:glucosylceramidase
MNFFQSSRCNRRMRANRSAEDAQRRRLLKGSLAGLTVATIASSVRGFAADSLSWTAVETARDNGHRLAEVDTSAAPGEATINVEARPVGPAIIGFGGALTDSAARVLAQLPKDKRLQILRNYFDPKEGIGYTLARTHMTACDFSQPNWTCDDSAGDMSLRKFSLKPLHDKQLPLIKDVQRLVGADRFKLVASPWSPPAWMKTNGEMAHGGTLGEDAAAAWANYYVRFVKAMRDDEKIPVWALTVQNEPDAAQSWESCLYSPFEERDFIIDHLGPALENAQLSDVKLFGWDHNRSGIVERAVALLGNPHSAKYLAGLALHWYQQEDFAATAQVLKRFPSKQVLFTEGCVEGGPHLNEWEPAERYARNMIGDFTSGICGFIDWNIALDTQGGPNHTGNFCHAPVLVDTKSGAVHVQPSFYYIAHFSKFLAIGARRLASTNRDDALASIAFGNPDGSRVVIVANPTDAARDISLSVGDKSRALTIPAHAIHTHVVA